MLDNLLTGVDTLGYKNVVLQKDTGDITKMIMSVKFQRKWKQNGHFLLLIGKRVQISRSHLEETVLSNINTHRTY